LGLDIGDIDVVILFAPPSGNLSQFAVVKIRARKG